MLTFLSIVVAFLLFGLLHGVLGGFSGSLGSQVAFRLLVEPSLVGMGIAWACAIALLGGLLPAIHAARLPAAVALPPA